MASKTTDKRIKIGTRIESITETLVVTKVLKHAYKVTTLSGCDRPDVWSWEVHLNHLNQFCVDNR
jgi:hypothetical protein